MFRILIFILFIPQILRSQTVNDNLMLSVGCDIKPDRISPFELNFKRISKSPFSFCGKFSFYSYSKDIYPTMYSSIIINWKNLYCSTHTEGASIKPGWIFFKRISEKKIFYFAVYGVVSETLNTFTINYLDVNGETHEVHNQNLTTFGTELETHYSRLLFKHFNFGVSFIAGLRQNHVLAFNDVINNYSLFGSYSPAQGYSSNSFYVTMAMGIGIPF